MEITTGSKPYTIIDRGDGYEIREFSDYNPNDLFWHRDKEDRTVELVKGDNISIQFDNTLPVQLRCDEQYFIPEMVYHRVIASSPFTVKIIF